MVIYLVKNGTSITKRFSLLDKQAYFFGGPVRLEERPDNGPRSAFLAANEETEATFISNLMSNTTDAIATSYQEASGKDPWPTPPALGKAPAADTSGIVTKADAESALQGTANDDLAYRRIAIDDQSSPPTSVTVDLTGREVFVFQGVVAFPAGHSLLLVIADSEASNVSGWASSSGLTFTELFDSTSGEPNYPDPDDLVTQTPFAGAGAAPAPPLRATGTGGA
ncbi:MAG TPA: hypothetical protein VFS43_06065 [Polyangiaceae bacterium]|nr:hypothetical protein [Polyangiaceae bacterium]